jgi:hypothetical protein
MCKGAAQFKVLRKLSGGTYSAVMDRLVGDVSAARRRFSAGSVPKR